MQGLRYTKKVIFPPKMDKRHFGVCSGINAYFRYIVKNHGFNVNKYEIRG